MKPEIEMIAEKKLTGLSLEMSLANNKTGELWRTFSKRKQEVKHAINTDLISLQLYPKRYFEVFNPNNTFTKWAGREVSTFDETPDGMQNLIIPSGYYAVFDYRGSSQDQRIFQYIFTEWLPGSPYRLDDRPHFELLGEKYRNADPNSEEKIFIPITKK